MAFREKSAWIMALALLLGGVFYFGTVISLSRGHGGLAPPGLPLLVFYTAAMVATAVVGHAVAAAMAPREAGHRPDEREELVIARAGNQSAYVLAVGVLLSLGAYLLTGNGHLMFYVAFGSLMAFQLYAYAAQIMMYRTGV